MVYCSHGACTLGFRVKQLDYFSACNYQIGDRAYYHLKPDDTVVSIDSNMQCYKPRILHTHLFRKGLLTDNSRNIPNKKSSSPCVGVMANGTVTNLSQVMLH